MIRKLFDSIEKIEIFVKKLLLMALILNLESSTEVCSANIARDGEVIDIHENNEGQNHARLLTVFIEELLSSNNLKVSDLDAIAVSRGPGSYTGLRIGVSAAKGLCYGAGIPLIAISSLKSMAHYAASIFKTGQNPGENAPWFCPMIDARRMEVFTAFYDNANNETRPISAQIIDNDSFRGILDDLPVVFFGNGAAKCKSEITHTNAIFLDDIHTSSKYMAPLAEIAFQQDDFVDVAYFEPFYLKDFIATQPKKNIFG